MTRVNRPSSGILLSVNDPSSPVVAHMSFSSFTDTTVPMSGSPVALSFTTPMMLPAVAAVAVMAVTRATVRVLIFIVLFFSSFFPFFLFCLIEL